MLPMNMTGGILLRQVYLSHHKKARAHSHIMHPDLIKITPS